ncbi:MAG: hypothetical protein RLZZ226_496 [Pseudomonadota bacterium]
MNTYEKDFFAWTQEQSKHLNARQFAELDIENLVEEIQAMGRSERRELQSRLTVLLVHLLKWQFQPTRQGRSWQLTIEEQRDSCLDIIEDNPSLKTQLDALASRAYAHAKITASKETGLDKTTFPSGCPWSYEQMMDADFLPD